MCILNASKDISLKFKNILVFLHDILGYIYQTFSILRVLNLVSSHCPKPSTLKSEVVSLNQQIIVSYFFIFYFNPHTKNK